MRLTYLDEGGISSGEPKVVVAGVIVHGDHQLVPVEKYLRDLIEKHIPVEDRSNFVFHATDIFSGGKYFKDKEKWPWEKRASILEDLADIPGKFGLPIVHGIVDKHRVRGHLPQGVKSSVLDMIYHACAFSSATQLVELYFRDYASDEFTIIIAEDRQKIRKFIKSVQKMLQGHGDQIPSDLLSEFSELPYAHIRDTVHWAGKQESPLLQVADVCAFFVRGAAINHPRAAPFLGRILRTLLPPPKVRVGVMPSTRSS